MLFRLVTNDSNNNNNNNNNNNIIYCDIIIIIQNSQNVSMAWIDARKAFDSVSHRWLVDIIRLHKFPAWMCETVARLYESWNTRITAITKEGRKISDIKVTPYAQGCSPFVSTPLLGC